MWSSVVVKDLLTPVCYAAVYLVQKTSMKLLELCTTESNGIDWVLYFLGSLKFPVCMKTKCCSISLVSRSITGTFYQPLRASTMSERINVIFTSLSLLEFLYALLFPSDCT